MYYTTHCLLKKLSKLAPRWFCFPPLGAVLCKNHFPQGEILMIKHPLSQLFLSVCNFFFYLILVMFVLISLIWRSFFSFSYAGGKNYNLKWNVIFFVLYTNFSLSGKIKMKKKKIILCVRYNFVFYTKVY